jgi:hypothetical protein
MRLSAAALDQLIEEITTDANGDDEQLSAFAEAMHEYAGLPLQGFVAGGPVTVLSFRNSGSSRGGLTAKIRRADHSSFEISAADLLVDDDVPVSRYLAAYRKWMGLRGYPAASKTRSRAGLAAQATVELIVLSKKQQTARCRVRASGETLILRADVWDVVPGQIVVVQPKKQWTYARQSYLSGAIVSARIDAAALSLTPLALHERYAWDPAEESWAEPGEPLPDYLRSVVAWGPRPAYEMEQIVPGMDIEDPFSDPILEAVDRKDYGDFQGSSAILMDLCIQDLRCLDAHAHLGNLWFDNFPEHALLHYEVGVRIGELSLGDNFDGVLPWGFIDNRPFLRCMSGYGLCLWRLERFAEAEGVFDRMLWLNPKDNQGIRFLIDDVREHLPWRDRGDE